MGSDSEDDERKQAPEGTQADDAPAPEGAVISGTDPEGGQAQADESKTEAKEQPKKEEPEESRLGGSSKPSYTLHFRNLEKDVDLDELKIRLERFGEVVSVKQEEDVVVAKFSRTNEAYDAHEKLTVQNPYGKDVVIEFGPQDSEHYNRAKRKGAPRGQGPAAGGPGNNKGRGMRAFGSKDEEQAAEADTKRRKVEEGAEDVKKAEAQERSLTAPSKAVSKWSDSLSFEEQLEDFMKMPRKGMYNRYLVLGKLPPELRTGENIWRLMQPVQRDIIQVEMLTCFGKPVAHVTLRSATAAAAMHRLCEQHHEKLTVAFAPPRKATPTLWLGNVDDFVPRKSLEKLLNSHGKILQGLRYLPARTCAFATFADVREAIKARNQLYGLEIQRNQYLNVDFVDDADAAQAPPEAFGMWGAPWGAPPPWGMPPPGPWGGPRPPWMPPPGVHAWGHPPPMPPPGGRHGDRDHWRNTDPWGAPGPRGDGARLVERGGKRGRGEKRYSRSPHGRQAPEPRARRKERDSPSRNEVEASEQPEKLKKIKLYKMGEMCCNIVPNFVKGKENTDSLLGKLQIDQRTKIDHCKAHLERAGQLATVWHFSAADRRDCAAYDALCDYFVEKQRVGLVQTPSYYVYIVPPTEKYLKELNLPASNFVVGLQIPIKK
eukprot:TRINITY_DN93412_c0_g1_i1.p1 TRINITY_DN93412_c0_g1~~TRINITY_DN93412_c0_g1_i1.p1  ORF type:complete len:657 (+),score=182.34 TRINITY_DN93412_c0_g1_i1:81-2051(+)